MYTSVETYNVGIENVPNVKANNKHKSNSTYFDEHNTYYENINKYIHSKHEDFPEGEEVLLGTVNGIKTLEANKSNINDSYLYFFKNKEKIIYSDEYLRKGIFFIDNNVSQNVKNVKKLLSHTNKISKKSLNKRKKIIKYILSKINNDDTNINQNLNKLIEKDTKYKLMPLRIVIQEISQLDKNTNIKIYLEKELNKEYKFPIVKEVISLREEITTDKETDNKNISLYATKLSFSKEEIEELNNTNPFINNLKKIVLRILK